MTIFGSPKFTDKKGAEQIAQSNLRISRFEHVLDPAVFSPIALPQPGIHSPNCHTFTLSIHSLPPIALPQPGIQIFMPSLSHIHPFNIHTLPPIALPHQ